jgi:hypothetical protein
VERWKQPTKMASDHAGTRTTPRRSVHYLRLMTVVVNVEAYSRVYLL